MKMQPRPPRTKYAAFDTHSATYKGSHRDLCQHRRISDVKDSTAPTPSLKPMQTTWLCKLAPAARAALCRWLRITLSLTHVAQGQLVSCVGRRSRLLLDSQLLISLPLRRALAKGKFRCLDILVKIFSFFVSSSVYSPKLGPAFLQTYSVGFLL